MDSSSSPSPELLAAYKQLIIRRTASFATDGQASLDTAERAAPKFAALRHIFAELQLEHLDSQFKFIHVTGTSGKGSVVKLIHDILVANGQRVGSLVTPYTTTFLESFLVNQGLLNPATLINSANKVLDSLEKIQLPAATNLPIAIHAFQQENLDWTVIEAGRGGRFDATNIIPAPKVAVITNVDLDHCAILGHTLKDIAWQKAGIIKKGCHVVCGEPRPELQAVFQHEANQVGATIEFVPWHPNYLERNKAIARAVGQHLKINQQIIDQAVATSQTLPCRFETMQSAPLVILDGAHNPAKIATTANRLAQLSADQRKKLIILFACKSSKDAHQLLQPLIPFAHTIHTTRYLMGAGQSSDPEQLLALIPSNKRGVAYDSPHIALTTLLGSLSATDTLLSTGSLYLAGELRTHWVAEQRILTHRSSLLNPVA